MSQDELNKSNVPDPEVVPRAKRRHFSAEYKLRILEEAEACSERGQIGSLLRREGLYSSHLTTWRRQREQGQLDGLSPKKRGRKPAVDEALVKELAELKQENQRLENRLQQAETIIEVQKKLSGLLGLTPEEKESDEAT
ncbi:MAG: transposase [Anaerolineae bacterium]|nr:transposase [Anaerolineae bacterium]